MVSRNIDEEAASLEVNKTVVLLLESLIANAGRRTDASLRGKRNLIDNRLRILASPDDPDHPRNHTPLPTAAARERLRRISLCLDQVRTVSHRLTGAADLVQAELDQMTESIKANRPGNWQNDLVVLLLAECWKYATGEWPGASATDGKDTGPFARWVLVAIPLILPSNPAPAWVQIDGSGSHIKNAILRLRKRGHIR